MHYRAYVAAVMACLMLSACSPYIYKTEIDNFHGGMDAVVTAYETGSKELAADTEQAPIDMAIGKRTVVGLTAGCSITMDPKPPCALWTGNESPLSIEARDAAAAIAAAAPAFSALKNYAEALAAITNANDDVELRAAMQDLTGSLGDLAATVEQKAPGAAPSKPVIEAGGTLFAAAATAYLDHRRFQALRAGVLAADPLLPPLAVTVSDALLSIRQQRLILRSDVMRVTAESLAAAKTASPDYRAMVQDLRGKTEIYTKIRSADQAATVKAMTEAHNRLAEAVRDDSRQVRPVINAAKAFHKAAKQFRDSFTSAD